LRERIRGDDSFDFLRVRSLVDHKRAVVVRKRPGHNDLALLEYAGEILAVRRAHLGDEGRVRGVLDDGGDFHVPTIIVAGQAILSHANH
jgi:hypothetical protein